MNPKVLVVDDEPSIQRMYQKAFLAQGFDVSILADGVGVVEFITKNPQQIIILDIMLPTKNGIDTLSDLKANEATSETPVIIMSAYEDDDLLMKALNLGAERYIVKSMLEPTEVVNIAKQVISNQKS